MTTIVREKDADRLLGMAGAHLCGKIREVLAARAHVNLAVPGGRNVVKIFEAMRREQLDWRRVHCFVVDERLVPVDHPDSNFRLLRDHLIDPLAQAGRIAPGNAHPFVMEPETEDRGAKRYERILAEHGFRFDVLLLSAGEDGHVGALFPRHHSIGDRHHGFIVMDDSPKPPPGRISSSRSLMQTADAALLLFVGEGKREAHGKFDDPRCAVADCPAKLVLAVRDVAVFTDLPQLECDTMGANASRGPGGGGHRIEPPAGNAKKRSDREP